jgi:hypothetical protein
MIEACRVIQQLQSQKRKVGPKRGRTQPFLAGFQFRRECTEGLLGGWLAQRQAALREVMAAGALPTFTLGLPCVPVLTRAPAVPEKEFSGKVDQLIQRRASSFQFL